MNRLVCWVSALLAGWVLAAPAAAQVPRQLRACGDVNEFVPFTYFVREDGKKSATVTGLNVDVLQAINADSGRSVKVDMLPWARCLLMAGRGEYDIVFDGIKTPERERSFRLAVSHYSLTPVFLFLKGSPRPRLRSAADLANQRICSQADYNYESFGIDNKYITNRARSIDDAATMLKLGRCALMLQEVEVLRAHARLGGMDVLGSGDIEVMTADWIKQIDFYFMVSRAVPYSKELLDLLDRGIVRLKKNGEIERLRNKHEFR